MLACSGAASSSALYRQLARCGAAECRRRKTQGLPGSGTERAAMEAKTRQGWRRATNSSRQPRRTSNAPAPTPADPQDSEQERQAAAAAQEHRFQELQRAHTVARVQTPPPPAPRLQVATLPAQVPKALPVSLPNLAGGERRAKVLILRSDKTPSFTGCYPFASRAETPYLPAGSYAEGQAGDRGLCQQPRGRLTGALCGDGALCRPVSVGGPGRSRWPRPCPSTAVWCSAKPRPTWRSASSCNSTTLSASFPMATPLRRPGGLCHRPGRHPGAPRTLETREGTYLAKTFLTSLLAGAAEAFALAKRTVVVTPFGGTVSTQPATSAKWPAMRRWRRRRRGSASGTWGRPTSCCRCCGRRAVCPCVWSSRRGCPSMAAHADHALARK